MPDEQIYPQRIGSVCFSKSSVWHFGVYPFPERSQFPFNDFSFPMSAICQIFSTCALFPPEVWPVPLMPSYIVCVCVGGGLWVQQLLVISKCQQISLFFYLPALCLHFGSQTRHFSCTSHKMTILKAAGRSWWRTCRLLHDSGNFSWKTCEVPQQMKPRTSIKQHVLKY